MNQYFFFIDDVIWPFRDLSRQRPASIFDHPFLGTLKRMNRQYGLKTQLNIFFSTDPSYGGEGFDLTQMPDIYREEFRANASWLRFAFHAEKEFPGYPYVNISYDEMKAAYTRMRDEVYRFAGEEIFSHRVLIHFNAISKAGCQALRDCGVTLLSSIDGADLPEDYAALSPAARERMLTGRTEETTRPYLKTRSSGETIPAIRAYNHLSDDMALRCDHSPCAWAGNDLHLPMKEFCHLLLNLHAPAEIERLLPERITGDFIGIGDHEQYFYPDYSHYQPDYQQRIETACRIMQEKGWQSIRMDELAVNPIEE